MRFLFCSVPSHGFLFPAMSIAQALEDRGHETAFVTDVSRAGLLARHGLRRIPRGDRDGKSFALESWYHPLPTAIDVKHIEAALEIFPADALIGQPLTLAAYLVRERRGLPLAVLGVASPLWPLDPELAFREPRTEAEERRLWRHETMMGYLNQARRLFRLPVVDSSFADSPLWGDLYLAQSVPEMWRPAGALARKMIHVGSCLWEPTGPHAALDAWLADARSAKQGVIYMEFGRNFQAANPPEKIFACLGGQNVRVAASLGRCDSPVGEAPENFLVSDFLPQGRVLRHADLVISGGNSTVTLGALTHGLPSLILHGGGEQTDLAELCAEAGAAIALPVQAASQPEILEAIQELLARDRYRLGARVLQEAFARYGGPTAAAAAVEELAAEREATGRSPVETMDEEHHAC